MIFNKHSNLEGLHAPFSPSQPSWLNYSDDHLMDVYANKKAAEMGTRLHAWACETIKLKRKQPRTHNTIDMYVNDAIGFHMQPEVVLYYSDFFFGTADSISYKGNILRIHDLKTGVTAPHPEQLETYCALFCLEYHKEPMKVKFVCRLYQNNDINEWEPEPERILHIMDTIVHFDKLLRENYNEED